MEKRVKWLAAAFAVLLGLLACRVAYIQILGHKDLTAAAEIQQQITLEGADTRGVIYDRNGTPIAGEQQEYIFIIEKSKCDGETLNALQSVDAEEVANENNGYRVFTSRKYSKEAAQRLITNSDAYIMEAGRRYRQNQPAVHIVGYVNEKDSSGASGLELMYDEELSMLNKKVSAVADVQGHLIQGYGLRVSSEADKDQYFSSGITTTLDLGLQLAVEESLKGTSKNAAAVVLDCKNGEILAAASTPKYDPTDIGAYIDSSSGELINKVTQGEYPPGSVFKIAVAAAALQNGISEASTFVCKGYEEINGHRIECETGGSEGHGNIDLKEAFAESCNCAFIQLAQLTGSGPVIETARSLGLGTVVLERYPDEKSGNLMTSQQSEGAGIANLAIGQGETLTTPLQIAQMTAIIANGGNHSGVKVIKNNSKEVKEKRVIKEETAAIIREMMGLTVEEGTGSGMKLKTSAGAKTGSAESSQNGIQVVHGWITGFVPAEKPEYVITVFVEDGRSGRSSAAPLFAEIEGYLSTANMIGYEIGL